MLTRTRKFDHISSVLSVFTGCQFGLEFILKSFSSPGKHVMTWNLLTSANLLIFTIHHVNFVLHIKTFSPFFGLSLPMTTEPFTHVHLNSETHFLQIETYTIECSFGLVMMKTFFVYYYYYHFYYQAIDNNQGVSYNSIAVNLLSGISLHNFNVS